MTGTLLLLSSSHGAESVALAWLVLLGVLAKVILRCGDAFAVRERAVCVSAECFTHFEPRGSRLVEVCWYGGHGLDGAVVEE
jgi:hypothetical protein